MARWREASLPERLEALTDEAVANGVTWMRDFPADWQARAFTATGEALFLATDGPIPVAMAVISADPFASDGTTGRLRYIYVADRARGRGLFRVLVEACLLRGRHRWRRLRLHTDNPVAARVYESYGFLPVGDEVRSTHRRDGVL